MDLASGSLLELLGASKNLWEPLGANLGELLGTFGSSWDSKNSLGIDFLRFETGFERGFERGLGMRS